MSAYIIYRFRLLLIVNVFVESPNPTDDNDNGVWWLTGFGPGGGGAVLTGGAELSADSSSCLLMSSVVKRLDSSPKMWMIANLLEGLGWKEKKRKIILFEKLLPYSQTPLSTGSLSAHTVPVLKHNC